MMRHFVALDAPIDLNLLRLFVRVADAGSFAKAAIVLGIERSSVSRAVANLEQSLKIQLFSRTTRRVALTTAGTALYARVAPQLRSLNDALGTLPEREEQPSGHLRITGTTDFGALVLPPLLAGFALRYPDVTYELRFTSQRLDLVAEGFDIALRVGLKKLTDSTLRARKVGGLVMEMYAAPSYLARAPALRAPSDLAEHVVISVPRMKLPRGLPALPPQRRLWADDILFILGAAKAGMGVAFLPTFAAKADVAAGHLVRVLPRVEVPSGTMYVVHPPAAHVPRKVIAFRDYVTEYLAAHPLV